MEAEKRGLTRCFIALELQRSAIESITRLQELIKKKNFFYGKFTEPENLHLTLKFLGEIEEEKINNVKEKLKKINIPSFEVSLGELGLFSEDFLRILWIKLNGKEIWHLQEQIDENLKDLFPKESRFMSHITLARIKKVINKPELIRYIKNLKHPNFPFQVKEFCFKKSELKPEGPVYKNIERYALK